MACGPVVAEAQNPESRLVRLESHAWNHVLEELSELADHLHEVVTTIREPEFRDVDARPGRERYFKRAGPLGCIRVVTEFAGEVDRVVTAFPQSNDPRPPEQLRAGESRPVADTFGTPEGHAVRFDEDCNVIGITIVNAKWLLDRDGKIGITVPEVIETSAYELAPALRAS
jgi:uncharacterized protein YuzE